MIFQQDKYGNMYPTIVCETNLNSDPIYCSISFFKLMAKMGLEMTNSSINICINKDGIITTFYYLVLLQVFSLSHYSLH